MQLTLCDPIRQVTLRTSETIFYRELYNFKLKPENDDDENNFE